MSNKRLNSHPSADTANYTPHSLSPSPTWGEGSWEGVFIYSHPPPPTPLDWPSTAVPGHRRLAQPGAASPDWPWHLAMAIFVTKAPPAYGVGHNCHNLDPTRSSSNTPAVISVTYGLKCVRVSSNPEASNMLLHICKLLLLVVFIFFLNLALPSHCSTCCL